MHLVGSEEPIGKKVGLFTRFRGRTGQPSHPYSIAWSLSVNRESTGILNYKLDSTEPDSEGVDFSVFPRAEHRTESVGS